MSKLRLLKDLPNAEAGEIFEYVAGRTQQLFSETSPATFSAQEIKEYDILNSDKGWFEKIEEKKYGGRVPKDGDEYWIICGGGVIESENWGHTWVDESAFECGNAFWTEEEAEKELKRRKAYAVLKEDTKGFKPDWGNDTYKYVVTWTSSEGGRLFAECVCSLCNSRLCFATKEDAQDSIKAHSSEWKAWLGVEDE